MGFKFFVYHDDEGNITSITNEKRSTGEFIEADEAEIADFLNGSKDFTKFKIQNLTSGTKKIKLASETSELVYKDFYIINKSDGTEQVVIEHNSANFCWNIKLNDSAQLLNFSFYICHKDNLNFLIKEIKVPAKKIFSLPFENKIEEQINDFVILTKRLHKSYGINYA